MAQTTLYRFHPDKTVDKMVYGLGVDVSLVLPADGNMPVLNKETVVLCAQIGMAFAQLALSDPAEAGVRVALINAMIEKGDVDALIVMTGNVINEPPPDEPE